MEKKPLKLAFVSGLTAKKLSQKLAPLQVLPEVGEIHLYRRQPYFGEKIRWMIMPKICTRIYFLGDLWRMLSLLIYASQYDLLIGCHQRYHGLYAAVAGVLRNKPVLQLVINDPRWIMGGFLGKWTLEKAIAIGFRGDTTMRYYKCNVDKKKHCFIPHNVWHPSEKTELKERLVDLLYVGSFAGYKNITAWLQTAALVKKKLGKLNAVLVGDKPNKKIQSLLRNLRLENDIKFAGPLHGNELEKQYAHAKTLLLTSFWEGLPMVALEAMYAGVPVIATDVGDTKDLVKDGKNGYLTKVGDIEAAANAVVKILREKNLHTRLSSYARNTAREFIERSQLVKVAEEWRQILANLNLI